MPQRKGYGTWRKANEEKLERIKRRCLKCDREFMARGRFNRICRNCQKGNHDFSHKTYICYERGV